MWSPSRCQPADFPEVTCCLPDARSQDPTAATGAVMRPETLKGCARRAGFADVEALAVDHELFRFYRLDR